MLHLNVLTPPSLLPLYQPITVTHSLLFWAASQLTFQAVIAFSYNGIEIAANTIQCYKLIEFTVLQLTED